MERWRGKVAIVTGASSGIGEKTSESLVKNGLKVVGIARRMDKLKVLASKLGKEKFFPIQCDMRKEEEILKTFKWIEQQLGGADILVNNAGVITGVPLIDSPTDEYYKIIETNLIAPTICAREIVQSLKKRNASGHVININSITGHFAESMLLPLGLYCASKYAVTALGAELRHEMILSCLNVKITSISPGIVETEMTTGSVPLAKNVKALKSEDIAEAIIYVLGTAEHVEIPELTVVPRGVPIHIPAELESTKQK